MKRIAAAALCAILSLALLAAIPAFAEDHGVTIEAKSAEIGVEDAQAAFDVYFKDVTEKGLSGVMFTVSVEGATFDDAEIGPDMPGSYMPSDTGKDKMTVLWVDVEKGVFDDILAATFTITLPEGLKEGDELPVKITLSDDPDNYLTFTGEENVTASAVDGKLTVVSGSTYEPREPSTDARVRVGDEEDNEEPDLSDVSTDGTAKAESAEDEPGRVNVGTASIPVGTGGGGAKAAADQTPSASSSLSIGAKIGIIAGAVVAVCAALAAVLISKKNKKKDESGVSNSPQSKDTLADKTVQPEKDAVDKPDDLPDEADDDAVETTVILDETVEQNERSDDSGEDKD